MLTLGYCVLSIYDRWRFDTVPEDTNDLAVHQGSNHILSQWPYWLLYPDVTFIFTPDLHGQVPENIFGQHSLRSFVNPNTTFENEIWPAVGETNCQSLLANQNRNSSRQGAVISVIEMLKQQSQPQQTAAAPLMDIQAGTLINSDVATGQFEISSAGTSQIMLYWSGGDVNLALTDPLGNPINNQSVGNTNFDYLSVDTGFGLMATYHITNTLTGTWTYTISATTLDKSTGYRLFAVPSTPIAVRGSVPAWLPNNSPVTITATVSYSAVIPVSGGSMTAQIQRPDNTSETITLFDDGNHHDGPADDGVFGAIYDHTNVGGFYGILFTAIGSYNSESYRRTGTAFLIIALDNADLSGQYSDHGI